MRNLSSPLPTGKPPRVDPGDAIRHVRFLFCDGDRFEVRRLGGARVHSRVFEVVDGFEGRFRDYCRMLERLENPGDLYITPACVDPILRSGQAAADGDVVRSHVLWIDSDVHQPVDALLAAIKDAGLPRPSMVLASGSGGAHCYWLLSAPIEGPEQLRGHLKALAAILGSNADPACTNPARVLRVGGGFNSKPQAQKHARIVELDETRTYDLSQFPPPAAEPKQRERTGEYHDADTTKRRAEKALESLDPHIADDQDVWVRIAVSAKRAGVPYRVFDEWSRRGNGYDAEENRLRWNSFALDGAIGPGTLIGMARDASAEYRAWLAADHATDEEREAFDAFYAAGFEYEVIPRSELPAYLKHASPETAVGCELSSKHAASRDEIMLDWLAERRREQAREAAAESLDDDPLEVMPPVVEDAAPREADGGGSHQRGPQPPPPLILERDEATNDRIANEFLRSTAVTLDDGRRVPGIAWFGGSGTWFEWIEGERRHAELSVDELADELRAFMHTIRVPVRNKQGLKSGLVKLDAINANRIREVTLELRQKIGRRLRRVERLPASLHKQNPKHPDPAATVVTRNAVLSITDDGSIEDCPRDASLLAPNVLPFAFDADAPEPTYWLRWLDERFAGDADIIELIREWFGLCVTGDTSMHRMLVISGPPRSGKSTLADVLSAVVGKRNVAFPSFGSLGGPFGLQPLLSKTLAIMADANFKVRDQGLAVERLKSICGEDEVDIGRKHLQSLTVRLPVRFVLVSNDEIDVRDDSGALAARMLPIRMPHSFEGREDGEVRDRLLAECPSILNWSLVGLQSLRERGRFLEPQSVREGRERVRRSTSPVRLFCDEVLEIDPAAQSPSEAPSVADVFASYLRWAAESGVHRTLTKQGLTAAMRSAHPSIGTSRGPRRQDGSRPRVLLGVRAVQTPEQIERESDGDLPF